MLPGMELMGCANLAVPPEVMRHVVRIESSFNPYAIGVVGGRLARQPRNLSEAVSTARMLEREGYNFSLGLAQVNRYNLASYGLHSFERAFDVCPNLQAGSRILAECYQRSSRDWGKAFSCYYSGNFVTGFRHGYVQKVLASWRGDAGEPAQSSNLPVERRAGSGQPQASPVVSSLSSLVARRIEDATINRVPHALAQRQGIEPVSQAAVTPQTMIRHGMRAVAATVTGPSPSMLAAAQPKGATATDAQASDDGPVVVQLTGVPPPMARPDLPRAAASQPTPAAESGRDAAFVF